MRSLYIKIFLWFWLAMILLVFSVMWTTRQVADLTGAAPPQGPGLRSTLHHMKTVEARLASEGEAAAVAWMRGLERREKRRLFLVDQSFRDVLGRGLPPDVAVFLNGGTAQGNAPGARLLMSSVRSVDGAPYYLIARLPPSRRPRSEAAGERGAVGSALPPRGRGRPHKRSALDVFFAGPISIQWTRLAVAVIVSGFVCFLLARYLAGSVQRLRTVTHQLAAGDLSARVGESLSGRRDELGELGRDFDSMAERLEALISAQTRLLRDVSHELRSPLARLQVALGLARKRVAHEAGSELDRIELETERLNELIGKVLTLAGLERNLVDERAQSVDLVALLERVVADADYEARDRNRTVRLMQSEPAQTRGRAELLRSAIENVVRNAIRYTHGEDCVEVSLVVEGDENIIRVRDHGGGVPEHALSALFEPFYRADEARDRDSGGSGIGLAIVERTVRNHGGSVAARNAVDGGLVVELRLPGLDGKGRDTRTPHA